MELCVDQATRAHRRTVALLGATLVTAFGVLDVVATPQHALLLVAVRILWTAALLASWRMFRDGSAVDPRVPEALSTIGSAAAALVVVGATGGPASGYFGFLFALPFCMALLLPGALWCAAVSGILTTAGGAAFLVAARSPALEIVRWVATALGMAILATYAALASRRAVAGSLASERVRAELAEELAANVRRLALAERLATAGRLAAGVAHEVNNPLAFLHSNLEWLRAHLERGAPLPADVAGAIDDARHGVERISRIVADLRGFCAPAPDCPCGAPIADAVDEALRVVSHRLDPLLRIRVDVSPDLPHARICQGRLVQVLGNLVENASDATASACTAEGRDVAIRGWAEGGRVRIAVEDRGAGIPADALGRLFEPFFTTKPPGRGTGLGLALAREYVTTAHGTLEASNRPGGGARFVVDLVTAHREEAARCPSCSYTGGGRQAAAVLDAWATARLAP